MNLTLSVKLEQHRASLPSIVQARHQRTVRSLALKLLATAEDDRAQARDPGTGRDREQNSTDLAFGYMASFVRR